MKVLGYEESSDDKLKQKRKELHDDESFGLIWKDADENLDFDWI